MAIINKTGITNGGTIQAEHITRAIDALSGVGTDSIIASGSFTGSFTGSAGITNLQIGTNGYFISETSGIVLLNATNNSLDTQIRHRNGTISSSFSNSGLLINAPVRATSFTGSLLGTLTGTASFATTASYALNAIGAGTEYHTLTFFHTPVTNTVDTNETFIGGFPTAPTSSGNAIGLICPFNCTIIRAAATSYVTALRSAAIDVDILIDGSVVDTVGTLNLNSQYDSAIATYTINVSAGQLITIGLTEAGNTNAVWSTNTTLLLKST
jgi:hypothetical protein